MNRTKLFEKFLTARARYERDLKHLNEEGVDLQKSAQFSMNLQKKYLDTFK
jgi:hypothetical protein